MSIEGTGKRLGILLPRSTQFQEMLRCDDSKESRTHSCRCFMKDSPISTRLQLCFQVFGKSNDEKCRKIPFSGTRTVW
jgi:hypothetical protein